MLTNRSFPYTQKCLLQAGEGNGNPLQHSCLEKSYGCRSLVGYSLSGPKESNMTEQLSLHIHFFFFFFCAFLAIGQLLLGFQSFS